MQASKHQENYQKDKSRDKYVVLLGAVCLKVVALCNSSKPFLIVLIYKQPKHCFEVWLSERVQFLYLFATVI